MKRYFIKSLLAVFYVNFCLAQDLIPPIQNYSSVQYGAASQNWGISVDDNGIIYAANNEGLLRFDGLQWELFPLQTGSIIRSVYPHEQRIYTGSYQEFGYWSNQNNGDLRYTSLIPQVQKKEMRNEEIWDIVDLNGNIYLRSFAAIYKYDHEKIELLQNVITNAMTVYKGKLIVSVGQRGIFSLEDDGSLIKLLDEENFSGNTVIDMEADGDHLLIGTRTALYTFDGTKCQLYRDVELNSMLERYELNHIKQIAEDTFVFATVKNGIIHYEKKTREKKVYNRNSGLQNNTVLGMALNKGKLWLGLDNGIDAIDLNSAVNFYTDDTGELGAVYDLAWHNSRLYLASNTGVYEFIDNNFHLVEGAEGHSWNLEVFGGEVYSNHNTGTYKIKNSSFLPVEKRTGSFDIVNSEKNNGSELLIGNYTGISIYSPVNGEVREVRDVNFPIKKIIQENETVIWAAHPYEGVYRVELDKSLERSLFVKKIGSAQANKADVFQINKQIAVLQDGEWFRYDTFSDSLVSFKELTAYKDHRLLLEDRRGYWFTNSTNNSIIFTNFKDTKINLAFEELNSRSVKGHEKLVRLNDSIFYITLNDGFGTINLESLLREKQNEFLSKPFIFAVEDTQKRYNLKETLSIPYKNAKEISIKIGLPDSDASQLFYELQGESNSKGKVEKGNLTFQNLSDGSYSLNLFALSPQERSSEVEIFQFEVLPPWYFSNLMKFVYFLLLLSLIGLIYYMNRLKLKKHRLELEQKFKKEHEERMNKLEKERLLNEINSKRKELANTTLIGAKKNEVLMEIQGELNKDKDKFSNQFRLKHIINKINSAVKNKDEWNVFETNFNELHEDFFKELLKQYPQLSNRDLKLCSYLKMNLSSKEIAPLMGISVRGVEVHRYRLRKKMGLKSKANLTNFMIKNY